MGEPLHCLVEIPKGSRNKYEWDESLGGIKLDRFLFSSVHCPTGYADDKGQDDKILCVPHEDPNWRGLRELDDLPDQLRGEIEHFFSIYKQPEGKDVAVDGWYERDVAQRIIDESRARWREKRS